MAWLLVLIAGIWLLPLGIVALALVGSLFSKRLHEWIRGHLLP